MPNAETACTTNSVESSEATYPQLDGAASPVSDLTEAGHNIAHSIFNDDALAAARISCAPQAALDNTNKGDAQSEDDTSLAITRVDAADMSEVLPENDTAPALIRSASDKDLVATIVRKNGAKIDSKTIHSVRDEIAVSKTATAVGGHHESVSTGAVPDALGAQVTQLSNDSQAQAEPSAYGETIAPIAGLRPADDSWSFTSTPELKVEHIAPSTNSTSGRENIGSRDSAKWARTLEQSAPRNAELSDRVKDRDIAFATEFPQAIQATVTENRIHTQTDIAQPSPATVDVTKPQSNVAAPAHSATRQPASETLPREAALTPNSYPQYVHDAKLVQQIGGSEWRVGLHVPELGRIEIKTSTHEGSTQAQLAVERAEVHRIFAASEVELGSALARHNVEFSGTSLMHSSTTSGGEEQRQPPSYVQESNHSPREHGGATPSLIAEASTQARTSYSGSGLNILA